jgi:hypothetical protein
MHEEEYVTYMPGLQLRPFIHGLRLTFQVSPTLVARRFPPDWCAYALRSAIKGLYSTTFKHSRLMLNMPSPKLQSRYDPRLTGLRHAAALRPHMGKPLVLATNTPLACGFQASSTLSLNSITEVLSACRRSSGHSPRARHHPRISPTSPDDHPCSRVDSY